MVFRLFAGAVGLLALHAAADSFLAPERGTGPGDHLLRGGVTLALLALAVAAFPRLRAGGQAALAGVLGVLALEGFGLAVAGARAVGARGDDWTGFLLAPAGAVLLGLAVALLWRSRKPGRFRWLRRAGIAAAVFVVVETIVLPLAVAIGTTHRPRARVDPVDLGRPYERATLRTADGLDLAAWYVPSRNGAAVISFPTREGQARPGPDARAARLRRPAPRHARLRRLRGRPEHVRLGRRRRTSTRRSPGCSGGPTSAAAGSAGSASRSAAR